MMNTNTPNQAATQKANVFFREHFGELSKFISEYDLTESPMQHLLYAYDYDMEGLKTHGKEEVTKWKNNCKWRIGRITEMDIFLGIEAFLKITAEESGFFHKKSVRELAEFRKELFDLYFELCSQREGDTISAEMKRRLTWIGHQEEPLGLFLSYFGIINETSTIGGYLHSYQDFASKMQTLMGNDKSYVFFLPAFYLFKTIRNVYATHNFLPDEIIGGDYSKIGDYSNVNALSYVRFYIYFYVTLCTLLNRAWRMIEEAGFSEKMEEGNHIYKLERPLFTDAEVNVRIVVAPLEGQIVKSVLLKDEKVDIENNSSQEVDLGWFSFDRFFRDRNGRIQFAKIRFEVTFSEISNPEKLAFGLADSKIWDGTTVFLRQGRNYDVKNESTLCTPLPVSVPQENAQTEELSSVNEEKSTEFAENLEEGPAADQADNRFIDSLIDRYVAEMSKPKPEPPLTYETTIDGVQCRFARMNEDAGLVSARMELQLKLDLHRDFVFYSLTGVTTQAPLEGPFHVPEYIGLPDGQTLVVRAIGPSAFEGCQLSHIILPDSVRTIGRRAFAQCKQLWQIRLSDNIKTIGDDAFRECTALKDIILPKKIHEISNGMFMGCTRLKKVELSDYTSVVGNDAFRDCKLLDSFKMVCGSTAVMMIGDRAFLHCENLKEVVLPDYLGYGIGEEAFKGCHRLPEIVIPRHVNSIKRATFEDCVALKKVVIKEQRAFKICQLAFAGCAELETVSFEEKYLSVNEVESKAFAGCVKLKTFGGMAVAKAIDHIKRAHATCIVNGEPVTSCIADDAFELPKKRWFSF